MAVPVLVKLEIALGASLSADPLTWSWTNATTYLREGAKVTIKRGSGNESPVMPPASCVLEVDNSDGRWCRLNPSGAWYGSLRKNTPIRISVDGGSGYVTRFVGLLSNLPPAWDKSGNLKYARLRADGRLRNLNQGKPIISAMRRAVSYTSPLAYWSLEDGKRASKGKSGVVGGHPMKIDTAANPRKFSTWGSEDIADGSGPVMRLNIITSGAFAGTSMTGRVDTAVTDWSWQWICSGSGSSATCSFTAHTTADEIYTPTYGQWLVYGDQGAGTITLKHADVTSGVPSTTDLSTASVDLWDGDPHNVRLHVAQSGANVAWSWWVDGVSIGSGSVASYTLGAPAWVSAGVSQDGSLAVGHMIVESGVGTDYSSVMLGNPGEMAHERIERLCTENGIGYDSDATESELVGGQFVGKLVDNLSEAAKADHGILFDGLNGHLTFVSHGQRESLASALVMDYESGHVAEALAPADDDQLTRNQISVTRRGGSTETYTQSSGSLGTTTVGVYEDTPTLLLYDDDQPVQHAAWLVHLGQADLLRYPSIVIDLRRSTDLVTQWLACDIGSRLTIDNPPAGGQVDTIDAVILGYTEVVSSFEWRVTLNTRPYEPWKVGIYADDAGDTADFLGHYNPNSLELLDTAAAGATALTVWVEPLAWTVVGDDFPHDVVWLGERTTITACRSLAADSFTGTRSNGWGTSDGAGAQVWSTGGGSASDYAVGSGVGTHSVGVVNSSRRTILAIARADVDVVVSVKTAALATGAAIFVSLMGRYIDSSNYYFAELALNTDQTVDLRLRKNVAATLTTLTTLTIPVTHAAGTYIRLRMQVVGTTFRARAWTASGTEPTYYWQVSTTDSDLTAAGDIGCRSLLGTGNTNTLPFTVTWDDFELPRPQVMTATRAVNGVAKSLPAGTDGELHPDYQGVMGL